MALQRTGMDVTYYVACPACIEIVEADGLDDADAGVAAHNAEHHDEQRVAIPVTERDASLRGLVVHGEALLDEEAFERFVEALRSGDCGVDAGEAVFKTIED